LSVESSDVLYLANLCHDCGACLQACPYAPPHEFRVDIPEALGSVRLGSYRRYTWPRRGAGLFDNAIAASVLLTCAGAILAIAAIIGLSGMSALTTIDVRAGSFYRVVPWLAMLIPSLFATGFGVIVIAAGAGQFWREMSATHRLKSLRWRHVVGAVADAMRLQYLDGAGPGCYYPDRMRPSSMRRTLHHAAAYGFGLCFAATAVAAFEQDVLSVLPPYPLFSIPVVLGTIGGICIIVGTAGLLGLKLKAFAGGIRLSGFALDASFLMLLMLASLTGLLLLALRGTAAMGGLLAAHLATLLALYATFPYGKFVHAAYRFTALVKNRAEHDAEVTY